MSDKNCLGRHRRVFVAAAVICCLALSGCSPAGGALAKPNLANRPARAVVTTGMIADIVKVVGSAHVEVTALMGPGVDPHQYKATAGDLTRLQQADIVFYNGLHLEGKMAEVFEGLGTRVRTVAVTRTLDPDKDLRPAAAGYEGTHDPHVWFDVRLWMKAVECVRDALAELDPAHGDEFRANAERYLKELTDLDAEVKTKAMRIPADRRVLVTAHDAFYYFGRAYGFEVRGLQGISTATETNTRDVDDLARFIADRKIPAVFGESSVPDRNLEAVLAAVRQRHGYPVKLLGGQLFSDALGDAGTPEGTYVGMVRHNIDVIAGALAP
jgi:manganese/zinc/iron transport system substrate-binding protein